MREVGPMRATRRKRRRGEASRELVRDCGKRRRPTAAIPRYRPPIGRVKVARMVASSIAGRPSIGGSGSIVSQSRVKRSMSLHQPFTVSA